MVAFSFCYHFHTTTSKGCVASVFTHGIWLGGRNILSRMYLRNCKVLGVDAWKGHWLGDVVVQHLGGTLIYLTFVFAIVTLTFKIFSRLHLRIRKI